MILDACGVLAELLLNVHLGELLLVYRELLLIYRELLLINWKLLLVYRELLRAHSLPKLLIELPLKPSTKLLIPKLLIPRINPQIQLPKTLLNLPLSVIHALPILTCIHLRNCPCWLIRYIFINTVIKLKIIELSVRRV